MRTRKLGQSQTLYLDCGISTVDHGIDHWANISIPEVGAVPEDSVDHLRQAFAAVGE